MADEEDSLSHYGVKGMKWGIRKKDEPTGSGSSKSGGPKLSDDSAAALEEYKTAMRAQKPLTGLAASKNLQNNLEKFHNKADEPGPPLDKAAKREARGAKFDERAAPHQKRIEEIDEQIAGLGDRYRDRVRKRTLEREKVAQEQYRDAYLKDAERAREGKLTSGQRKALIAAGVGAVVVGGIAYSSHKNKMKIKALEEKAKNGDVDAKLELYNHHVMQSKVKTWMFGSYVTEESWGREEFELPEGHTFHRISTRDESSHGYRPGTYCTPNEADFNRYVAGFRQEKGPGADFHHVTFTTKKATKVPNLQTTVETLRETMQQESAGLSVSRAQALAKYQELSGGSWDSSTSQRFFNNLQKKGYSAIVDEMDAGVLGERPLVFFDTGAANPKQARPLSSEEISVREKSIELMTRPPRKA